MRIIDDEILQSVCGANGRVTDPGGPFRHMNISDDPVGIVWGLHGVSLDIKVWAQLPVEANNGAVSPAIWIPYLQLLTQEASGTVPAGAALRFMFKHSDR